MSRNSAEWQEAEDEEDRMNGGKIGEVVAVQDTGAGVRGWGQVQKP